MTTYSEVIESLKEEERITELYRFQGPNNFDYFNIKTNHFDNSSNHYVYFSRTKNHHYYFSVKRIRQLINTTVLKDTPYIVSNRQLKDDKAFHKISNLIINSDSLKNLNSITLICDSTYYELLKSNSVSSSLKKLPNLIEKVDSKIYGGGYGVSCAWLNLLDDLTFFSAYTRITNKDVLDIIKNMKKGRKITTPYLVSSILENKKKTYRISDNLHNTFHKYNIMNDLEEIYEQKLYLDSSSPTKTINKILTSYQKNRDKILIKLDNSYHKYY